MADLAQDTQRIKKLFLDWFASLDQYVQRGVELGRQYLPELQRYSAHVEKRAKAQRNTENVIEALEVRGAMLLTALRQTVDRCVSLMELQESLEFYDLGYQITELSGHWKLRTYVINLLMRDQMDEQSARLLKELADLGEEFHEKASAFEPYRELQFLYKQHDNHPSDRKALR